MKNRFFAALIAILTVLTIPATYASSPPTPGGACSNAGYGAFGGGTNLLVCDGAAWQIVLQYGLSGEAYFTGGNVGIGTTSPQYPLHVVYDQNATTRLAVDNFDTGTAARAGLTARTDTGGNLVFTANSAGYSGSPITGGAAGAGLYTTSHFTNGLSIGATSAPLRLFAGSGSTERVHLASSGNVGIGTTNFPTGIGTVLNIRSTGLNGGGLTVGGNDSSSLLYLYEGASGYGGIQAKQPGVTVDSLVLQEQGGNVGIGTTDPQQTLVVKDTSTAALQLTNPTWGDAYNDGLVIGVNDNDAFFNMREDAPLRFLINDIERIRLTSAGKVGIGTATPTTPLQIDNASGYFLTMKNPTGATADKRTYRFESGAADLRLRALNDSNAFVRDLITFQHDGNVGIGTTDPTLGISATGSILTISNNDPAAWSQVLFGNTVNNAQISFRSGEMLLGTRQADPLYFKTNNTERMRILPNGNVGIGTTSPSGKLSVVGQQAVRVVGSGSSGATSSGYIQFYDSDDATSYGYIGDASQGDTLIYLGANSGLQIQTGAGPSNAMIVDSDGNVGIGTTDPKAELHVSGSLVSVLLDNAKLYGGLLNDGTTIQEIIGVNTANMTLLRAAAGYRFQNSANYVMLEMDDAGNVCGVDSAFEACSSDARLKEDVRDYGSGSLFKLRQLRPVTFTWNETGVTEYGYEAGRYHTGFLAQEIINVFPEWVSTDENGYYTVDDGKLRFVLLRAVQELAVKHDEEFAALKATNENQQDQLEALRAERDALKAQLDDLRAANDNVRATNELILRRLDALEGVRKAALP